MKRKKDYIYIVIIFIVTIILLAKLFILDRYEGHDTIFHVPNIIKLAKTISLNNLLGSNLITYSFNKFGYGMWLFYPKLPHLSAAYIYLLTKDIYLSMKIVYFITTFLSGVFTYFLSKKIFKDKKIALLSSIIYLTVPYHICEIYIRDAFAENIIFLALPMIFLGLYNLKEGNYKNFYLLFPIGYIIGINSHLISMVFYTFFIGIFVLYYYKDFFKKEKIKHFIISVVIVTLICLPFLTNIIEHKMLNIYRVFTEDFSSLDIVQASTLELKSFIEKETLINKIMPYFNVSTCILFVLSTVYFIFNKKDENRKDNKILLILIIILVTFICSKEIWTYLPKLLLSIQFPWRLLVLLSLVIAIFSPIILLKIPIKIKNILLPICIIVFIFEGLNNIDYYKDKEVNIDEALNSKDSMGFQNEYIPNSVLDGETFLEHRKYYFEIREYEIISDKEISSEIKKDSFPDLEFEISNLKEETKIELPRFYYLGYKLEDEKGNTVEIYNNNNGFIESKINKNGDYKLTYKKSVLNRGAIVIRNITIIIIIIHLGVKIVKWKKRK